QPFREVTALNPCHTDDRVIGFGAVVVPISPTGFGNHAAAALDRETPLGIRHRMPRDPEWLGDGLVMYWLLIIVTIPAAHRKRPLRHKTHLKRDTMRLEGVDVGHPVTVAR